MKPRDSAAWYVLLDAEDAAKQGSRVALADVVANCWLRGQPLPPDISEMLFKQLLAGVQVEARHAHRHWCRYAAVMQARDKGYRGDTAFEEAEKILSGSHASGSERTIRNSFNYVLRCKRDGTFAKRFYCQPAC